MARIDLRLRIAQARAQRAAQDRMRTRRTASRRDGVRFEVDGEYVLLEQGDVLHLKATIPHRWENAAEGPSRMFFVVTPVPAFAKQKDAAQA